MLYQTEEIIYIDIYKNANNNYVIYILRTGKKEKRERKKKSAVEEIFNKIYTI